MNELTFDSQWGPRERGQYMGEQLRSSIQELFLIRQELLLKRSPHLKDQLKALAEDQLQATYQFNPLLLWEIQSIAEASQLESWQIALLNNYTDFRDIHLSDEGCSSFSVQSVHAGQTWDMHQSALDHLCLIHFQGPRKKTILSVSGCLALMGVNEQQLFVGINNIATRSQSKGVIWPALVRDLLETPNVTQAQKRLLKAKVCGGHAYLLADPQNHALWEISPDEQIKLPHQEILTHANHSLSAQFEKIEIKSLRSGTTEQRQKILNSHKDWNKEAVLKLFRTSYPEGLEVPRTGEDLHKSSTIAGVYYHFSQRKLSFWENSSDHPELRVLECP